jgi:hypothetical protein
LAKPIDVILPDTEKLDGVVDQVYDRFETRTVAGEQVRVSIDGNSLLASVESVHALREVPTLPGAALKTFRASALPPLETTGRDALEIYGLKLETPVPHAVPGAGAGNVTSVGKGRERFGLGVSACFFFFFFFFFFFSKPSVLIN